MIERIDPVTGIANVQNFDPDMINILFSLYSAPIPGGYTLGLLNAVQQVFGEYLVDPRDIKSGWKTIGGTTPNYYTVKVEEDDLPDYLSGKVNGLNGITLTVSGTTNKIIDFELDIQETTEDGVSLLKNNYSMKKLVEGLGITMVQGLDTIEVKVDEQFLEDITYGIKYVWQNETEMNDQTGMSTADLGLREDIRQVMRYDGAVWVYFFTLGTSTTDKTEVSDIPTESYSGVQTTQQGVNQENVSELGNIYNILLGNSPAFGDLIGDPLPQAIASTETVATWSTVNQSSNTDVWEFNDTLNEVLVKKAGFYTWNTQVTLTNSSNADRFLIFSTRDKNNPSTYFYTRSILVPRDGTSSQSSITFEVPNDNTTIEIMAHGETSSGNGSNSLTLDAWNTSLLLNFVLNPEFNLETELIDVTNSTTESLSGTALKQNVVNEEFKTAIEVLEIGGDIDNTITVGLGGAVNFNDHASAISSIIGATQVNPYNIESYSGVYPITSTLLMKDYVSLKGTGAFNDSIVTGNLQLLDMNSESGKIDKMAFVMEQSQDNQYLVRSNDTGNVEDFIITDSSFVKNVSGDWGGTLALFEGNSRIKISRSTFVYNQTGNNPSGRKHIMLETRASNLGELLLDGCTFDFNINDAQDNYILIENTNIAPVQISNCHINIYINVNRTGGYIRLFEFLQDTSIKVTGDLTINVYDTSSNDHEFTAYQISASSGDFDAGNVILNYQGSNANAKFSDTTVGGTLRVQNVRTYGLSTFDTGGNIEGYYKDTTGQIFKDDVYIDGILDLNSNKITSLTAGTASGEAVEYDQLQTFGNGFLKTDGTNSMTGTLNGTSLNMTGGGTFDSKSTFKDNSVTVADFKRNAINGSRVSFSNTSNDLGYIGFGLDEKFEIVSKFSSTMFSVTSGGDAFIKNGLSVNGDADFNGNNLIDVGSINPDGETTTFGGDVVAKSALSNQKSEIKIVRTASQTGGEARPTTTYEDEVTGRTWFTQFLTDFNRFYLGYFNGTTSVTPMRIDADQQSYFAGIMNLSSNLNVGGSIVATGGVFATGGDFSAGLTQLYSSVNNGTAISTKTGANYDFILADPLGNIIFNVPTGTNNVRFNDDIQLGGGGRLTAYNTAENALVVFGNNTGSIGENKYGFYSTTTAENIMYMDAVTNGVFFNGDLTANKIDMTLTDGIVMGQSSLDCSYNDSNVFLNSFTTNFEYINQSDNDVKSYFKLSEATSDWILEYPSELPVGISLDTGISPNFDLKSGGKLKISDLPTSSSGLSSGYIWNDGGTLKIV